ncbi:MAG: hypothetical protein LBE56_13915 [Tannerella sp.]|jgi:hypothetical protein|nr:hypothetical protein [Tannerella sp.]
MYNQGLFHAWVPKPGMIALIIVLDAVVLFINPFNAGNMGQMTSSTGIISEYYMWGSFATIIGMALVLPFSMRIKLRFRTKELMLTTFIVMAAMTMVVATTTVGAVVVVACLIFGIAKMLGMNELLLPIMGLLGGDRKRFYAVYYPIALISNQISTWLTSGLSLDTGWQELHYYAAGILFVAAMICVIFMHNKHYTKVMPFIYLDWFGLFLFGTAFMSLAYIFAFGKQQDWFNSPYVFWAAIFAIVSIGALVIRELNIKRPFLSFKLYKIKDVRYGIILLVAQGMYMGISVIMSIYTSAILGYNWMTNGAIGLMTLPGIFLAGFVAFHWTENKIPLKMYIFSGFAAYFLYTVMLYFMMTPELNISQLYLPQMLNGYGMCALFISIWIYALDKVPQRNMIQSVAPIMVFRSFVMMAFFTSLFGWLQYKFQWQSIGDLASSVDSLTMSQSIGTTSLRDIQLGAILASCKKILGYIIIAGIAILIFVLFHQFGRLKFRIAEYNVYKGKQPALPEQIADIAGTI